VRASKGLDEWSRIAPGILDREEFGVERPLKEEQHRRNRNHGGDDSTACEIRERERLDREAMEKGDLPQVSWQKIVEHTDHVVKLVGPDHVGVGSDFDGASMPLGMDDASKLPRLTEALLSRGYREEDAEKILGGNLLRVMEATEKVKAELNR
jgi:microsomal dipeptidase-like Zn-dependent dipeptidase